MEPDSVGFEFPSPPLTERELRMKPTISVDYISGWYDGPLSFTGHLDGTADPVVGYIRNDWDSDEGTERDFFVYKHSYPTNETDEITSEMVFLGVYTYAEIAEWPRRTLSF